MFSKCDFKNVWIIAWEKCFLFLQNQLDWDKLLVYLVLCQGKQKEQFN